mgnify:CR=1 FL=1
MEYSVEELKSALIEKCESEGILYATVAMDRRTKEMILPDTLQGALKQPGNPSTRPVRPSGK